jgi:hypothetical protein
VVIFDDPDMAKKEVRIIANVMTQEELIATWEKVSNTRVKRNPVSAEALDQIINSSTTPVGKVLQQFTCPPHCVNSTLGAV